MSGCFDPVSSLMQAQPYQTDAESLSVIGQRGKDYAILREGKPIMLFECKKVEQPNKMDERPFLEFNVLGFKEQDVEELKKLAKVTFDVDEILATANELKYTRAMQNLRADLDGEPDLPPAFQQS